MSANETDRKAQNIKQIGHQHVMFRDRDRKIHVVPISRLELCENGCSGEAISGYPVSHKTFVDMIAFLTQSSKQTI